MSPLRKDCLVPMTRKAFFMNSSAMVLIAGLGIYERAHLRYKNYMIEFCLSCRNGRHWKSLTILIDNFE